MNTDERIAALTAERDRLAKILAVEEKRSDQAHDGWSHHWLSGWCGPAGRRIQGQIGHYEVTDSNGWPIQGTRRKYALEAMEAAASIPTPSRGAAPRCPECGRELIHAEWCSMDPHPTRL